jgi:predicted metalloprotease
MTPGEIIALVKDVAIVIAIGIVIYVLVSYGKDLVKVADMKAVQKQLTANSETQARWRQEAVDADKTRDAALAQVAGSIAQQRAPVYVLQPAARPANPGAVRANPGEAAAQACPAGGTDAGPRVDRRPAVNALELKFETALAECYGALDKWPTPAPATHIF